MSDEPEGDETGSGNPLAQEAATWFARLRGPDAERHRPAFEAWLQRGALHLAAYNRAAEIFNMGKLLAEDEDMADSGEPANQPREWRWSMLAALVAIALIALAGLWLLASDRLVPPVERGLPLASAPPSGMPIQVATRLGEIRRFGLSDGSQVTLDADSLLTFAFDGKHRDLRLERGRARFDVAHDPRPFVVAAGGGTVTARGTIFDVSLSSARQVAVHLLRGRVDVMLPTPGAVRAPRLVSLAPGGRVAFAALPPPPDGQDDLRWTEAMADFDGTPLRDVVARANAVSLVKIHLTDARTGAIRLSGSFRITDGAALAERLAALFDLKIERRGGADILLHPRQTAP